MSCVQKKYSFEIAPQSYFTPLEIEQSYGRFLTTGEVIFEYPDIFSEELVRTRLEKIEKNDSSAQKKLELVLCAAEMQEDARLAEEFKKKNVELYGAPEKELFDRGLVHFFGKFDDGKLALSNKALAELVAYCKSLEKIGLVDTDTYNLYQGFFRKYFQNLDNYNSLAEAFAACFKLGKLEEKGWRLEEVDDSSKARMIRRTKTIRFGKKYPVRNGKKGFLAIAMHEVFGHAIRDDETQSIEISEGWAVLLEQLCDTNFKTKRFYRYAAAALALGVHDGRERKFTEVYEMIKDMMLISGRYSEEEAKKYAFMEVARIFRGGRPDIPGAVFMKDSLYFSGNIAIWDQLAREQHSYADFVKILEGKKEII